MGLFNATPDVINEISYFISGNEIYLLWLTGCKRLMYTMCQLGGVKRLVLRPKEMKHSDSWPPIIPLFKRLEDLSIIFGSASVLPNTEKETFASWPKTIRRLQLDYRSAESCWKNVDIAACFPRLETLELDGWTAFLPAYLAKMPTLTSLSLNLNNSSRIDDLIKVLPRELEHLRLPYNDKVSVNTIKLLPKGLKTLHTHATGMNPDAILHLPLTLTDLVIGLGDVRHLDKLPRTLLHLTLASRYNTPSSTIPSIDLPPKLQTLEIKNRNATLDLTTLPKGLTRLIIYEPTMAIVEYETLPATLTQLSIAEPQVKIDDSLILNLPKGLTCFEIEKCPKGCTMTNANIPALPPRLTKLVIAPKCEITGECFALLPRTLYWLELGASNVSDQHISDLPPFLDRLSLPFAQDLTNACAKHLPRGLITLLIGSEHFSFACVPDLPLFINRLEMGQTGVPDKYFIERDKRSKQAPAYMKLLPDLRYWSEEANEEGTGE